MSGSRTDGLVEQAIRRSHCSHADSEKAGHHCIGTCLITPDGIALDCKACGGDKRTIAPADTLPETRLVVAVLDALGIRYEVLSPEYKAAAANAARDWMGSRRWG